MNPAHQHTFRVIPWPTDPMGTVDARGEYAETYWLPILHPTAYLLGRRLAILSIRAGVDAGAELELHAENLAAAIGVLKWNRSGDDPGLAVYHRAMTRLAKFRLIHWRGANLEVRTRWRRLPEGMLSSLPLSMQHAEPAWWAREGTGAAMPEFIER